MKFIDDILNSITMYRLVLYCLIFILAGAYLLSLLGVFPFGLLGLPVSVTILVFSCWFTNTFLAKIYKVPTNLESTYITALILALLLPPFSNIPDVMFLCTVAFLAMASKYLINIRGKHIFNPAAFAILVSSITFNYSATWWVGDRWMFPAVFLSGLLVIKKVRKFSLVLTFLITAISTLTIFQLINGSSILNITFLHL
jgi:glycine betaine catabolism B